MQNAHDAGTRVLELMTEALVALDESPLPANIGAHLDLAIVRLREHLYDQESPPGGLSYAIG